MPGSRPEQNQSTQPAQEILHELGVPRTQSSAQDILHELGVPRTPEGTKPKHFRVSNNKTLQSAGHQGFSKKFVEHGCYSIDAWDSQDRGYKNRMLQHQAVAVGDILWLPESLKTKHVYRGVVQTKFKQSSQENPSFYSREDVFQIARAASFDELEHPHWRDADPEKRKAWTDMRCEYICQVKWSGPIEMDKSTLNEGFIAKSIVSRTEDQADTLDTEFSK